MKIPRVTRRQAIDLIHKRDRRQYTMSNLNKIGIPWPPPKGWKEMVIRWACEEYGINRDKEVLKYKRAKRERSRRKKR